MGTRDIHCRTALLPDGWRNDVLLKLGEDGMIEAVECPAEPGGATVLTGPVVPGMPNLHSHGFQRLLAGLTGRRSASGDSFWSWREAMYRMAGRLDPESLEACMGGVFLEMLRNGYTSCAEFHYLHHAADGTPYSDSAEMSARVISAAKATGIALTLLPVLYCRSGFEAESVLPEQRRFANSVDDYLRLLEACARLAEPHPTLNVGLAPHSLRAVGRQALNDVLSAAARPGRPVHMHVAEQTLEVREALASLGDRPLQWLLDHFDVNPAWCLVHATHLGSGELERAARTGAVAGLCPSTEADLGDGIFAAEQWHAAGGRMGVGSDSNLVISAVGELRLLEFTQRLVSGRRNVLADNERSCGRLLYESCVAGGAQALAQPVGRISAGCRADLVELDERDPVLSGLEGDALLDGYVFAGGIQSVRSVFVAGRCRIQDGVHPAQESLLAAFRGVMRELRP